MPELPGGTVTFVITDIEGSTLLWERDHQAMSGVVARHPDLPATFPPLRSLGTSPHNLPRQPTPFLGREQQVNEVADLLRREHVTLVTLIGPGGTGKTRLALQAAAEVLGDFPDGVFFVPLAPLTDTALVLPAIPTTLGLREESGQPLIDRLRDALAARAALLVLDNREHRAEAAPAIGHLLGLAPRLKVAGHEPIARVRRGVGARGKPAVGSGDRRGRWRARGDGAGRPWSA